MVIMGKQDSFWENHYSLSSIICTAMNMNVWNKRIQCPKGHYDKTELKRVGRRTHWKCNVCGRQFWTEEFKMPTSVPK